MGDEDKFNEEQFKKDVIAHIKNGKYARALNLLNAKVQGLLILEAIKEDLQDGERVRNEKV